MSGNLAKVSMNLCAPLKCFSELALQVYVHHILLSFLLDQQDNYIDLRFFFTQETRGEAELRRRPNSSRIVLLAPRECHCLSKSAIQISVTIPEVRWRKMAHLLKVHVTTKTTTTESAHTTHTTHVAHIEVLIDRCPGAFLLILINPFGKIGLDVRAFYLVLREAGPVITLEVFF